MRKFKLKDCDWMTEEGEPVIIDGIAQRDIKQNEKLVTYGKIAGTIKNTNQLNWKEEVK